MNYVNRSRVRFSALSEVTLLQRTDTARQWPGASAAIDLQSDAGTASLSQRQLRTDGPGRCRNDINYRVGADPDAASAASAGRQVDVVLPASDAVGGCVLCAGAPLLDVVLGLLRWKREAGGGAERRPAVRHPADDTHLPGGRSQISLCSSRLFTHLTV
jgi:hypothetical protein